MNRETFLCVATASSKYHQRRHTFLWIVDTTISLIIVVSAASSFGFLIGGDKRYFAQLATACITLLGLCQIILGIGKASAAHAEWYKRWRGILLEVERTPYPTEEQLAEWNTERMRIETECVAELRALEVDCRNHAITSLDYDESEIRKIHWWQKMIIHIGILQSEFPRASGRASEART